MTIPDNAIESLVRKMASVIADENTDHEASTADAVWDACGTIGLDLTDGERQALHSTLGGSDG